VQSIKQYWKGVVIFGARVFPKRVLYECSFMHFKYRHNLILTK